MALSNFLVLQNATFTRGHSAKLVKNRRRLDLRQHVILWTCCRPLEWTGSGLTSFRRSSSGIGAACTW